jgi:serine/threonine protein phosphatase Stp1
MSMSFISRAASHPGAVRPRNEDAFIDRGDIGLWAVADGAGGHGFGDVASHAVVSCLSDLPGGLSAAELLAQVRLRLTAVHIDLQRRAEEREPAGLIASTAVVLLAREDHLACLWAGDSRAYLLREGRLTQLTRDHSVVAEMIEAGQLAAEEARHHPQANLITRAVGGHGPLELDKVTTTLRPGDLLLLCSDGLFNAVPEEEIARRLAAGESPDCIVSAALAAGARDNVTALAVWVSP